MKTKYYILIALFIVSLIIITGYYVLAMLSSMGNPTGGRGPDYPYFVTTQPTIVKHLLVPKDTKLTYEEHLYKEGQQNKIMPEDKLTSINLPEGKTIDWNGVPVKYIVKFFNTEMRGFTLYADFSQQQENKKTKFSELWASETNQLSVDVSDISDWSFNKSNITDVESCGVNKQRYFKDDKEQQNFLDNLYKELQNN